MLIIDNFIEIESDHIKIREATKQGYAMAIGGDSINLEQPNSKTRRGRVGHQIAQTLTCSCNQGVVIDMSENKPILVGGIGEINFGKQFRQGNRVYDSNNIAMCLMAEPVGNTGGYSYLYKINNSERGNKMKEFKNEILKKLNFKMDEIKLFDSFAGIGSLHNSLQFLGVPTKIIGLSETDVDAIISYAGVHIDNFLKVKFDYPSEDEMRQLLMDRNIGWSFEKQKSCIPRLKKDKLYKTYKATMLLNNLGDVSKLDYENLPDFDLFNMSFPCTDISGSGKQKGLKNVDGTPTRSGLVKYGIEVIKGKKPKYVMIENVKALIQKKFIDDFYSIVNEIENYGYKIYYPTVEDNKGNVKPTCLNAKNYGIAQNRERIFVICVRNDINDTIDNFYEGFDSGLRLKDFLEDEVDEKYYLSKEVQDRFKLNGNKDEEHNELNVVGSSAPECRTIGQRDITYGTNGIMSTLTATDYKQPKQIINGAIRGRYNEEDKIEQQLELRDDKNTNSLTTVQKDNVIVETNQLIQQGELCLEGYNDFSKRVYSKEGIGRTLMASGGNLNDKAGQYMTEKYKIRRLTPKECWRLMGFTDEQFDKAKELGISDSQLYKQAGNSIVTNCLYYIFKELFKNYITKE